MNVLLWKKMRITLLVISLASGGVVILVLSVRPKSVSQNYETTIPITAVTCNGDQLSYGNFDDLLNASQDICQLQIVYQAQAPCTNPALCSPTDQHTYLPLTNLPYVLSRFNHLSSLRIAGYVQDNPCRISIESADVIKQFHNLKKLQIINCGLQDLLQDDRASWPQLEFFEIR